MEVSTQREIFDAVVHDDLKKFASLIVSNSDLNLCFGRFPLLSLCYLFGSYKILNRYERYMLAISNFKFLDEFGESYRKFRAVAGKLIRYYSAEKIIYPAEMLAIISDNETLAKNYKKIYKNVEIIENINKIYNFRLKFLKTHATETGFTQKRNKLRFSQKIVLIFSCVLLSLMMAVPAIFSSYIASNSGLGSASSPVLIKTENSLKKALEGKLYYKLISDITLTEEIYAESFSGTLDGNGHKIVLCSDQTSEMIKNMTGKISNLTVEFSAKNLEIFKNQAYFIKISTGIVEDCVFSGSLNLEFSSDTDTGFSVAIYQNNGTMSDCTLDVSIVASNLSGSNASVAGFSVVNNGLIENCEILETSFNANTVDTAGFVVENYGEIMGSKTSASITQSTTSKWHPYVAGVAIYNYGNIIDTINYGSLLASVDYDDDEEHQIYVGGIACISANEINGVKNYGSLSASSEVKSTVYIAGLVAYNALTSSTIGDISNSYSSCKIAVSASVTSSVYAGGLCGVSGASIDSSGAEVEIDIDIVGTYYAGGLVGVNYSNIFNNSLTVIQNCYSVAKFVASSEVELEEDDTEELNLGQSDDSTSASSGYLGGLVGGYIYIMKNVMYGVCINNCHYVKSESFNYPLYAGYTIQSLSYMTDSSGYVVGYDTLESLKQSASGVTFYE